MSPELICFSLFYLLSSFPVDSPDRNGATALLYACRALARLPSEKNDHPLFQWALALLRGFMAAGADFRARDNAGPCPAVLGVAFDNMQQEQFLENGSWNKRFHTGLTPHNSILSLVMAQSGYLGATEPIEGKSILYPFLICSLQIDNARLYLSRSFLDLYDVLNIF